MQEQRIDCGESRRDDLASNPTCSEAKCGVTARRAKGASEKLPYPPSHFSSLIPHFSLLSLSFLIFHFLLSGCSTSGCLENQSAIPKALFYTASVSESGTVTNTTIAIDSIQIWGVGSPGDSLLVNGRASSTYLPLRSSATDAAFCIHYTQKALSSPALNDTLTLTYNSDPRFISEECGAMYYYTVSSLAVTHHLIDSVRLTDSLVTNFDKETLRIYFRTRQADDTEKDNQTDPQP